MKRWNNVLNQERRKTKLVVDREKKIQSKLEVSKQRRLADEQEH